MSEKVFLTVVLVIVSSSSQLVLRKKYDAINKSGLNMEIVFCFF